MTLSRVVVLPVKVMRLTKYCAPSSIRIVMSATGIGLGGGRLGRGAQRLGDLVRQRVLDVGSSL
jgi:hypothetical protein